MKHSEQINELAAALSAAQGQFSNLEKNRTVKVKLKSGGEYTFDYATFDECVAMVRPHLAANGLSVSQGAEITEKGFVLIETLLMHSSGQWLSNELVLIPDDSTPQAVGSTITYGKRYSFAALLSLASEDDDDGAAGSGHTSAPTQRTYDGKPQTRPPATQAAPPAAPPPPKPEMTPEQKDWQAYLKPLMDAKQVSREDVMGILAVTKSDYAAGKAAVASLLEWREWLKPLLDGGTLTVDNAQAVVANNKGDYKAARAEIEGQIALLEPPKY